MELIAGLLLCTVVMALLWAWQRGSGRADWVDVAWAGLIGVLAAGYVLVGEGSPEKRILIVIVTGTWSFRLTRHLWVRLAGHETEDGRYQALRQRWGRRQQSGMFALFMAQGLLAWVFALPAWVVAGDPSSQLNAWVLIGVSFWLVSFFGEALADRQLEAFRRNPENRGKVCQTGLWRYSRHPNYFFEWLHWFAYPFIAAGAPNQWLTWLGPVIMLAFVYRLTGIPHTEQQALKSRGAAYRKYQQTTSAFVPWPRRRDSVTDEH